MYIDRCAYVYMYIYHKLSYSVLPMFFGLCRNCRKFHSVLPIVTSNRYTLNHQERGMKHVTVLINGSTANEGDLGRGGLLAMGQS